MKVLLVAGGWSPERDVSLRGATKIGESLKDRGHDVIFYDLLNGFEQLGQLAKEVDVAFINLHGSPGEDGLVQAFLERFSCPYQGARPTGSILALHKFASKAMFKEAGLNVAKGELFISLPTEEELEKRLASFSYPLFVKPNNGGSSLFLYKVESKAELKNALQNIFEAGLEALVEELVVGKEMTCGVLGEEALPPVLIVPQSEFFDFTQKYSANGAQEICPVPLDILSDEKCKIIQEMALTAHNTLGLSDYSRSDFIMTEAGEFFILETNTLPGMTEVSLVPKEAKAAGLEFQDLLEKLLHLAMQKKSR